MTINNGDINLNLLKNKKVALFGAGNAVKNVIIFLKKNNVNIVCILDNDKSKFNTSVCGIKIFPPDNSPEFDCIVVTLRHCTSNLIENLGKISKVYTFNEIYINTYKQEFEKLKLHLFDDFSRKTLENILLGNLTGNKDFFKEVRTANQYYCIDEFMAQQNEYMVDIGAYVGDSIEKFILSVSGIGIKKIYAFEPNLNLHNAVNARTRRVLKEWAIPTSAVKLYSNIICDHDGHVYFDISKKASNQFNHLKTSLFSKKIECTTIDNFFKNKKVSFIKADIEGAELSMLKGARNIIIEQKPKIAICVYHNINDLLDIINLIRNIMPEYKFALRHHSNNFSESVLYCWV